MARKIKTDTPSIVNVFNWAINVIDNNDLSDVEQLAIFHIMGRLNRNFWKETPISKNKLAAAMGKDKRTLEKALKSLIEKKFLVQTEGGYNLGYSGAEFARYNEGNGNVESEIDSRGTDASGGSAPAVAVAASELKIFNET